MLLSFTFYSVLTYRLQRISDKSDIHIMKILRRRGKFKDTEKIIRHHPFGISIGTDIVFGMSVPESTADSWEYRISFGIPGSGLQDAPMTFQCLGPG